MKYRLFSLSIFFVILFGASQLHSAELGFTIEKNSYTFFLDQKKISLNNENLSTIQSTLFESQDSRALDDFNSAWSDHKRNRFLQWFGTAGAAVAFFNDGFFSISGDHLMYGSLAFIIIGTGLDSRFSTRIAEVFRKHEQFLQDYRHEIPKEEPQKIWQQSAIPSVRFEIFRFN